MASHCLSLPASAPAHVMSWCVALASVIIVHRNLLTQAQTPFSQPILKRLRDRAAEKLVTHRSGKKNKKALKPTHDGLTDDLDLIGDDSHRRRSSTHAPSAVGRPAPTTAADPLAAQQASLPSSVPMSDPPPDALEQMNLVAAQFSLPAGAGSVGSPDQPLLGTPGQDGFFFPTTLDEAIAAQPNFPSDFNEFSSWTSDPSFGMSGAAGSFGYGEPERLGMFPAVGGGIHEDFDFDSVRQLSPLIGRKRPTG